MIDRTGVLLLWRSMSRMTQEIPMLSHFKRLLATLVLLAGIHASAWADEFKEGYAAYMRGDYEVAFQLLMPLADQGNAVAQNMVALMYQNGQGVPRNGTEAAKWKRMAAEQRATDSAAKNTGANAMGSNK
jgi:TPR repeat protein